MLRPQDNGVRECKRLDGMWDFALDAPGHGRRDDWFRGPLASAISIPVPSSYNDLLVDDQLHDHVGDVWYQRSVFVPRGWAGTRVLLRFDSATHRAAVWVEDDLVAEHEGGYTPFEADISHLAEDGRELRVTVVVNNELTFQSIPPGVIQEQPDGTRIQRYYHDFFNYAGLHRSVWLMSTPADRIDDVTVTTSVDGTTGLVHCLTSVSSNTPGQAVRLTLRDDNGALVAESDGKNAVLAVDDAELWRPGRGYLHQLTVELVDATAVVDRFVQSVGIRTVRVDGQRFLINDEPFYFRGFGMHEDHLVRGKGHDNPSMVNDFELLDWIGANSFRTAHYPYAEEILDEADRRGIVVIDETAAVGLNLAIGGGFYLGGERQTFSPSTLNDDTREVHRRAIVDLIDRDKNHPSVVLWSIANEPESHTEESVGYFEPLFAAARQADPSRPVGFVNVMLAPYDKCRLSRFADVVMLNRYNGWYFHLGDLAAAEVGLEAELRGWAETFDKPIIITEYGADAVQGFSSVRATPWSEDYQVDFLDMFHRVFDRTDAVVGEQVWNFADFETTVGLMRVGGNKKGVFTRERTPKAAARTLRQRWTRLQT
jgi:beta-glucuronidase